MNRSRTQASIDSGPPIGSMLPELPPTIPIKSVSKEEQVVAQVLLFVSMHCAHCIDLLPHLSDMVSQHPDFSFQLFSTGDKEDNQSMIEYFGWEFPVHTLDQSDMEAYLSVTYLPYMLLIDDSDKVIAKGVIYNAEDFEQLLHNSVGNLLT